MSADLCPVCGATPDCRRRMQSTDTREEYYRLALACAVRGGDAALVARVRAAHEKELQLYGASHKQEHAQ